MFSQHSKLSGLGILWSYLPTLGGVSGMRFLVLQQVGTVQETSLADAAVRRQPVLPTTVVRFPKVQGWWQYGPF